MVDFHHMDCEEYISHPLKVLNVPELVWRDVQTPDPHHHHHHP